MKRISLYMLLVVLLATLLSLLIVAVHQGKTLEKATAVGAINSSQTEPNVQVSQETATIHGSESAVLSTNPGIDSAQDDSDLPVFDDSVPPPDCSKLNRTAMAGAPPCLSPGQEPVKGSAKVALLFLAKDAIPTEPIWTAFIASAAELKLRRKVAATRPAPAELREPDPINPEDINNKCWRHGGILVNFGVPPREQYKGDVPPLVKNVTGWIEESCESSLTPRQLYNMQDLFSIYMHRKPESKPFPEDSIFAGRDIPNRINTHFAQPSLVEALRLLLREALKDERNSKFVLVSETCIPLHHPALVYAQLMAESHISRSASSIYNPQRWYHSMATHFFRPQHFQKTSQWVSLTRMHAQIVANDMHVFARFKQYCMTQTACDQDNRFYGHLCVADEHYVASVLAAYSQNEAKDSIGSVTYTDWLTPAGGWHPHTFFPGNAVKDIYTMRRRSASSGCSRYPFKALKSSASLFSHRSVCKASGDKMLKLAGKNYVDADSVDSPQYKHHRSTRRLFSEDGDSAIESQQQQYMDTIDSVASFTTEDLGSVQRTRKLTGVSEHGPEKDKTHVQQGDTIRQAMLKNLQESPWLAAFDPMPMQCPLFGRRVSWQAVSEFASLVWRCDGLGFAWECLHADGRESDL